MGSVKVCITVDWEGEDLSYLPDLELLRKRLKVDVPFTHYICPNYFVHDITAASKIKEAVRDCDEVGLHLHCYKPLVEQVAKVDFRIEQNYHAVPSVWEEYLGKIFPFLQNKPSGRGVPLSVYNSDEIKQIVETSVNVLKKELGLDKVQGFRAGGWIASDTVLDVVCDLGFGYDSSAVPPAILSDGYDTGSDGNYKDDYGDTNGVFTSHILKLWGRELQASGFLKNENIQRANPNWAIEVGQQPFVYNQLVEVVNNVGLTDFSSPTKTVLPTLKNALEQLKEKPDEDIILVYGCHLEGDSYYKALVLDFVHEALEYSDGNVEFVTVDTAMRQGGWY